MVNRFIKLLFGPHFLPQRPAGQARRRETLALAVLIPLVTILSAWVTALPAQAIRQGDGVTVYSPSGNTTPQYRSYTNSSNAFGSQTGTVSGTTGLNYMVRTSPTRYEAVAGYVNSSGTLQVMCFDGTTWTNEWSVSVGGTGTTRRFDISYETNSGDVIVLYSTNTASATNPMNYRTKAGSNGCGSANWSGATNLPANVKTTGTVQWVKMAWDRRSSSNLITAIWADSNSDLSAMVWSGTAWTNEPSAALETSLEVIGAAQDVDDFDVEYESSSGDVMVVWANSAGANGTNGVRYATCTGGTSSCTWSAATNPNTGTGDDATNLDISADPGTDKIILGAIGDAGDDFQIFYWSGSAWTINANVDTSASTNSQAGFHLVTTGWLNAGSTRRAVVIYVDSGSNTPVTYYPMTDGTVGSQSTFTATPTVVTPYKWLDAQIDPINQDRLMLGLTENGNLYEAKRVVMDSTPTFTWTNADGGASLATLSQGTASPYSFAYWRFIPTPTFDQSGYRWFNNPTTTSDVASNTIGTTTSTNSATKTDNQRKNFYDDVRSVYWSFYYDGSNVTYANSANGSSWTSRGTLALDTGDLSVSYKPGSSTVYLIRTNAANTLTDVRSGTLGATSISWGSATTVASGTGMARATLSQDSAGYIWVMYKGGASNTTIKAARSSAANSVSAFDAAITIGTVGGSDTSRYDVVPLSNQDMYFIWTETTSPSGLIARKWNNGTSSLGSNETLESFTPSDYSVAAVSDGSSKVHVTYISGGSVKYIGYSSGSWGTASTVESTSGGAYATISLATSGDIYVFWIRSNVIYGRRAISPYSATSWQPTTALVSTGTNIELSAAAANNSTDIIPLTWQAGTATPWNVQFYGVSSNPPGSVGAGLASQNTAATAPAQGTPFRLRELIHVANNDIPLSGQSFFLQYAAKGAGTCTSPGSAYSAVGFPWSSITSSAAWSGRYGAGVVSLNNKLYIYGGIDSVGMKNDAWSSSDGATWTQETASAAFSARDYFGYTTYNGKMWLMGGDASGVLSNKVYSSTDGATWTQVTGAANWTSRKGLAVVSFNNKLWAIGGNDGSPKNDVWSSSDGATWTQETGAAAFSARYGHRVVSFNSKLWLIGGIDAGGEKNDVWSSSNGVTWTQETGAAAFSARYYHTADVWNGKIWITGGLSGSTANNEVWSSSDGVTWTQDTSAGWVARHSHGSAILSNQMWVMGGYTGSAYKNDTWTYGGTSPIQFYNNTGISDDSALVSNASDPTHGSDTTVAENYMEHGQFTNDQAPIAQATDALWDFSLVDSSAPAGTTYCFRIVKSDNTVLDTYSQYPEITTLLVGPTMDQVMRGGAYFSGGAEQPFFWAGLSNF